jgi:hypothetical protein
MTCWIMSATLKDVIHALLRADCEPVDTLQAPGPADEAGQGWPWETAGRVETA